MTLDRPTRHVHLFCSVKGGVGKSALAVLSAELLARRGRGVLVLDCDMTGTSLADGLLLRAPATPTYGDGAMDLTSVTTGAHLTLDETREARTRRALARNDWQAKPPRPVFLNDILLHRLEGGRECDVRSCGWRSERDGGPAWLPSSPLKLDVAQALGALYDEGSHLEWVRRLEWVVHAAWTQDGALTDVVIDLPPGLFGFTDMVIQFAGRVARGEDAQGDRPSFKAWDVRVNPFLVFTLDRNDVGAVGEVVPALRGLLPGLALLCNRSVEGIEAVVDAFAKMHPVLGPHLPRSIFSRVGEHRLTLGRVFREGTLHTNGEIEEQAWESLRLGGGA